MHIADFAGEDDEDRALCQQSFDRAIHYIESFEWCNRVRASYVGYCVGGVIALVLVQIEPARTDVDDWMWVVVGDLPSAYLAPASPNPRDALEDYIDHMSRWVSAVREQHPTNDLIPVNAPPTMEWADSLDRRLDFLRREILPEVGEQV